MTARRWGRLLGARLRGVVFLAWRESRNARRRLLLFMSAISTGVAALVAIDSYASNVTRSVREQSRTILGADVALSSRRPFTQPIARLLDSLPRTGVQVARVTTFGSMASVPRTEGARLVQVRAVTPEFPFYGAIETAPAGRWRALSSGRNALADQSLLTALGARVGDTLAIGFARFEIAGVLVSVPGDPGIAAAFGPRVYIPARYVEDTQLLQFGSRAEYEALLRLADGADAAAFVRQLRPQLRSALVRATTARETELRLTRGIEDLRRFLGLVGLVALLLGGVGVASAIHAYVAEKRDTAAVLRCLGATSGQVLAVYTAEAAAMGLIGAAAGAVAGVAIQFALPGMLGGFLPVDTRVHLVPRALLLGLAVGVLVAVLFALRPLLALRRVSPLQALRQDVGAERRLPIWRDVPRLAATGALLAGVAGVAVSRAGGVRDGLVMSAGLAGALLVLWLSAVLLSYAARRAVREHWPFVVRQGIANLYRPANQTRPVMLALGFGAFLLCTLYLVQTNLLRQLSVGRGAAQANLILFDIQEDQLGGADSIVRAAGHPVLQRVPVVPMRIAAINGQRASELARTRGSWALRREYRSSYRDTLTTSERLVAGDWFDARRREAGDSVYDISLDQSVATELRLAVGDSVRWDVQGVLVDTRVLSLREVNFARFEPNFFVLFEPAALRSAPKSFVLLTNVADAGARGRLQRALVDRYPNVSAIDLSLVRQTIDQILGRVAAAVRFMALLSLATGVLVLLSAVAATRRQRVREGVLLKTLGATRPQIRRIMLAEYGALGALGSATGMLLSLGGAWALMRFMFKMPFVVSVTPVLAIAAGMMALTVVVGLTSGRFLFAAPPMQALREA